MLVLATKSLEETVDILQRAVGVSRGYSHTDYPPNIYPSIPSIPARTHVSGFRLTCRKMA